MKVFYDTQQLPKFTNAVLTIGSYDGVHLGHQNIIKKINDLAHKINGESVLLTFHPHPRSVVDEKKTVPLLSTIAERLYLFEKYGINNVVVIPFTSEFSQQNPEQYIKNFLIKLFNLQHIVIGYNHFFGKDRQGDVNLLNTFAEKYHFKVTQIEKQQIDDWAISSTKIREAILNNNITTANKLLGHPYLIIGTVIKGKQLGRTIGFPTANLQLDNPEKLLPSVGIYAVWAYYQQKKYKAMMSIGYNPTVSTQNKLHIEVNIFDFNQDIYYQPLTIEVVSRLRNEIKFDSLQALKEALLLDKQNTLKTLST